MSDCIKCAKILKLIKKTEDEIVNLELGESGELEADVVKTLKAICYEKIKAIIKKEKGEM